MQILTLLYRFESAFFLNLRPISPYYIVIHHFFCMNNIYIGTFY